jgi:hypothetical protein
MLDQLKEIKGMDNRIIEIYNGIIMNIKDFVKELITEAEKTIINLNQHD